MEIKARDGNIKMIFEKVSGFGVESLRFEVGGCLPARWTWWGRQGSKLKKLVVLIKELLEGGGDEVGASCPFDGLPVVFLFGA